MFLRNYPLYFQTYENLWYVFYKLLFNDKTNTRLPPNDCVKLKFGSEFFCKLYLFVFWYSGFNFFLKIFYGKIFTNDKIRFFWKSIITFTELYTRNFRDDTALRNRPGYRPDDCRRKWIINYPFSKIYRPRLGRRCAHANRPRNG